MPGGGGRIAWLCFQPAVVATNSRPTARRARGTIRAVNDLDGAGYAFADIELTSQQCSHVAAALPVVPPSRGGVRNLLSHPTVVQLLTHAALGRCLWTLVGRDLVAVRATLFDKTVDSNWRVQWHQDRSIAVRERLDVSGYGPWRTKSGSVTVEAPAQVLAQMIAVRIHLDASGPGNGPLQVIAGSHLAGKLSDEEIRASVEDSEAVELCAPQGAMLFMRPLLLHASTKAELSDHRRVLHVEFAPVDAISPLHWETVLPLRAA